MWRQIVFFLCSMLVGLGVAHADYPERSIRLIVPFPPGGVADTVARPIAEGLSKDLGVSVIVENRGGAGGAVGTSEVSRARPDGYTLLFMLSSISILPEADIVLERDPSYRIEDFTPIARVTADPTVLVVRADAPWNTVEEFLQDAKNRPGEITYGSSGIYGSMHVPMAMLEKEADAELMHVPYTGAGPAVLALMSGEVDALSSGPSSILQQIKSGDFKALAHWGDKPIAALPDVKSLKDEGYDVKFVQWSGLFAPSKVDADAIDTLRASMARVTSEELTNQRIEAAGSPIEYMDADEFQVYWDADDIVLRQAVQDIGKVD